MYMYNMALAKYHALFILTVLPINICFVEAILKPSTAEGRLLSKKVIYKLSTA